MEMEKFKYILEIDILRNSTQNIKGVLSGTFKGPVWVSKKTPRRPAG